MNSTPFRNAVAGALCVLAVAGVTAQSTSKPAPPIAGRAVLGVTVAETDLVASGARASKLLHQDVYNDKNEKVGRIDDLIVSADGTLSVAVVNVGNFISIPKRLVAVPVQQFAHIAPKAVLPGATKDSLKALPPFEYAAG